MAEWEMDLSASEINSDADLNNLKRDAATPFPSYALCLPNYSKLNGQYFNVESVDKGNIGYVSEQISGADGKFATPITLTFSFVRKKAANGVYFEFNTLSGDYCSDLFIAWYRDDELVSSKSYTPDGSSYLAVKDTTSLFNKVVITFNATNKPYRRLWLAKAEIYRLLSGPGLVINYGDVAFGGKEATIITTDDEAAESNAQLLLNEQPISFPSYATGWPDYSKLDGDYVNAPNTVQNLGFVSKQISGSNGTFEDPPQITLTLSQVIGSVGIELFFNNHSGDYCSKVNIKWYLDDELVHDGDFTPDSDDYFCDYLCNQYNKVIITFNETSKPYRPVVLTGFYYGIGRVFTEKEIRDCTVFNEIEPIGESLPANTLQFEVRNDSIPFIFEKSQKLQVFFDNQIIGQFYLTKGKRLNEFNYQIEASDMVSLLDGLYDHGGFINNVTAEDYIKNTIFNGVDTTVYIDDSIKDTVLNGWLPYDTRRNNLAQIVFAIGGIVDCSFETGVYIYKYDSTLEPREIDDSQIYSDATSITTDDQVTGVELTVHSWIKDSEANATEIYKGTIKVGDSITFTFSNPMYDVTATGCTISETGDNYVIVKGTGSEATISGYSYNHMEQTITKKNPLVYRNENIMQATSTTLVTEANAETVLNRLYDYFINSDSIDVDILLGNLELSNMVKINTFAGDKTGILKALNLKFYGEIKAEATIKCLG